LDLRNEREFLDSMTFDTLTEWPVEDKLPIGFKPAELIENAKNPGLHVRSLHEKGIDGSGVGIAIIDQPLLLGHVEYTSKINRYDETGLGDMSPQMHGSPVTSIAVGENIGVAPGASLTYFAVPMWEEDNLLYIDSLKKIFELNKNLPGKEKIRVVSISTGVFPGQPHYEEWKEALEQADTQGILVVTCDQAVLDYGILSLSPGKDPNDPESYKPGIYISDSDIIRVPGANKTVASHLGIDVYTFDRKGGMSWGTPYIAGLAALAFQVDPEIKPKEIVQILADTVTETESGPIVNPTRFIEVVHEKKADKKG
jgi:serine protease AprX